MGHIQNASKAITNTNTNTCIKGRFLASANFEGVVFSDFNAEIRIKISHLVFRQNNS